MRSKLSCNLSLTLDHVRQVRAHMEIMMANKRERERVETAIAAREASTDPTIVSPEDESPPDPPGLGKDSEQQYQKSQQYLTKHNCIQL